jgi:hypothetical protein
MCLIFLLSTLYSFSLFFFLWSLPKQVSKEKKVFSIKPSKRKRPQHITAQLLELKEGSLGFGGNSFEGAPWGCDKIYGVGPIFVFYCIFMTKFFKLHPPPPCVHLGHNTTLDVWKFNGRYSLFSIFLTLQNFFPQVVCQCHFAAAFLFL